MAASEKGSEMAKTDGENEREVVGFLRKGE